MAEPVENKPITAQDRKNAVGDIRSLPAQLKYSFSNQGSFEPKHAPESGEWLAEHKEKGQTFQQYLRHRANLINRHQNTLYLLPLGEIPAERAHLIPFLQKGLSAYFYPLQVRVLKPASLLNLPVPTRFRYGRTQLHSAEVLQWMRKRLPRNAYAMLAITPQDLYPEEKQNYVFGQASYRHRVGVVSLARFWPRQADSPLHPKTLERFFKIVTHETGHMFGLHHCTYYQCNMSGINHMQELDKTPSHLCPVCLRKLHHAAQFNPSTRYLKLLHFYRTHTLNDQSHWTEQRLQHIHTSAE